MLSLCHYGPALLRTWFQTDLGRENSATHFKIQAEKIFLIIVSRWSRSTSNFYAHWSKVDKWIHAENLWSILKLVYFDSRSWQSFLSTCDVFNCLFPLDVQNKIQLLSRVFCYSVLVCLLGFWQKHITPKRITMSQCWGLLGNQSKFTF